MITYLFFCKYLQDDKDPVSLIKRLEKEVNCKNIIFHYENNNKDNFTERTAKDLYGMSRFDILIRSSSYFSRVAELMGKS